MDTSAARPSRRLDPVDDLGFGSIVGRHSRQRLLNPDGSFNVERRGRGFWTSWSLYHFLLTTTWPRFLLLGAVAYLLTHAFFASIYLACGEEALAGDPGLMTTGERFAQAFFFSVHTLSTVGYGHIVPMTWFANWVMTVESLAGLFGLAIATGLVFARFSRPNAKIVFSKNAVIGPCGDGRAFQFRITNPRHGEIIELEAKVLLARRVAEDGAFTRRFDELELERRKVTFFPLAWTIVHPIEEHSPLHGLSRDELAESDAEFLVLLTGIDDSRFETVYARSSYRMDEVACDARFESLYVHDPAGEKVCIDIARIHDLSEARGEP